MYVYRPIDRKTTRLGDAWEEVGRQGRDDGRPLETKTTKPRIFLPTDMVHPSLNAHRAFTPYST